MHKLGHSEKLVAASLRYRDTDTQFHQISFLYMSYCTWMIYNLQNGHFVDYKSIKCNNAYTTDVIPTKPYYDDA